ncbi:alkaline phosphatase family protein [Verrucomicrobia bacterium]|jgi:predicted AlkP superfamily pyrophosphatase or phosphodiesterase|nr:alkaline phosphatase family protein [Verrucomicrobiota bacterium]MDA7866974.1 alkaline phosphatase family protein [Verrucomicrobiota bacterium]MDB4746277.1 alkaline phosphatase family protein [Verrucomicrobiota bacterium]
MKRLAVINAVGLCGANMGSSMPQINAYRDRVSMRKIRPSFPAVTCTAQSNYLTGKTPTEHGIVANGWYHRELAEVHFWKQPNSVVQKEKIWEVMRRSHPEFTCAKMFWWYNMYSTADISVTPRPMYPADGRKFFDIYSFPYGVRPELKKALGDFPFPTFWGPAAGQSTPQGSPDAVSRWIAESAKWVESKHHPDLNLIYLPHLDYNLQRLGPGHPEIGKDYERLDQIVGDLIQFFEREGVQVCLLSEYGISAVNRPIHLNREFRKKGWLTVKEELGLEMLDYGQSRVFGVADHQVCHIYINDPTIKNEVCDLVAGLDGVANVLDLEGKQQFGIDHERAGDLVAVAADDSWFTYYYWLNDQRAPDFARCVDIHRKPGYDPAELFLDPKISFPKLKIAWRLLQKKMGFRILMDLIPLDAGLVKGSHGNCPQSQEEFPVIIAPGLDSDSGEPMESTEVFGVLKRLMEQ